MLHGEGGGVQHLDRGEHGQRRRGGGHAPAQQRGGGGAGGQTGRTQALDQAAAPGEQGDLGDDGLGQQQADRAVRQTLAAPEQRSETVIGGVRALDQRAGQYDPAERA